MLGLKPHHKKYIRPVIGLILIITGSVFLLIPFIPLGYVMLITGAFFLAPVIPVLGRAIDKLKVHDDKNRIKKAESEMNKVEEKVDGFLIGEEENKDSGH